jgi:outer membrane protein OmpA-like peptidoglycan-associated protein
MRVFVKTLIATLFLSQALIAQEPQRVEGADSISNILKNSTKGLRYVLSDSGINSELNEVGTTFFRNKYIILSNKKRRHYETTFNEETNAFNNNLYCVDVDKDGNLSFPLLFSKDLDSKNNEGSLTFSPDQKTIFFTQENPNKTNHYELYSAQLDTTTNRPFWGNIKKIDLLPENYSVETPGISADGTKLYFASDIPGGFGGFDIYVAEINPDGTIGAYKNLGPNVNTKEDEKYPNVTPDNKHLYFSSKGHLNMGGYDVFRSSIVGDNYLQALNLGVTLNSRRDDLAFVLVDSNKGYVSTDKSNAGNFDILKFEIKQLEKGKTNFTIVEKKTGVALPNAKVIIKDEFGKTITETISDKDGKVNVEINPISYNYITIDKEGYELFSANFTSEKIIANPIELKQAKAIVTEDAIVIENIFFEFNKATLMAESELSLNKIVEVLEQFPNMKLALEAHTDTKGSQNYNLPLSDKRAKAAYDYLVKKGIAKDRLTSKGFGKANPVVKCTKCTTEEDQKNRRVEFKIIK